MYYFMSIAQTYLACLCRERERERFKNDGTEWVLAYTFFSFSIFHSLILTFESFSCAVWSASWLSLTHQLGSRPHTFVLWPGRPLCCTTCPTIMDCCHGPPPVQLPMTHLSYLAFQKLPLESLLAFWPSSSAQVLVLFLDASEEIQLEIWFNGFVFVSANFWNGTRRVGVKYSHY